MEEFSQGLNPLRETEDMQEPSEARTSWYNQRNTVDFVKRRHSSFSMLTISSALLKIFPHVLAILMLILAIPVTHAEVNSWERPGNMPRIQGLEVMCGANHMEVHLSFDLPFHGLVASKGMYGHQDCVYVRPRSGGTKFVFNIDYEKCGTKPDNHGKFYENTIVVQYDEELIEAWDEAKRLRCEWFNDYEKTATKVSPMVISDLEIVEMNFHGDNVDCWMEIQEGRGPWAPPLNGIVPLGTTLTMVIAVKDPTGEFDMRVKACDASDGQSNNILHLSDSEGCILRPKLLGKFSKVKLDDGRATVLTYAYMSAFKFPDMLNVHMRCTVEICRHGCPDHCAPPPGHIPAASNHPSELQPQQSLQEPLAYESQNNPVQSNDFQRNSPKLPATENQGTAQAPSQSQGVPANTSPTEEQRIPSDVLNTIRDHVKQQHQHDLQQNQPQPTAPNSGPSVAQAPPPLPHYQPQPGPPNGRLPPPGFYPPPPSQHFRHPIRPGPPPPRRNGPHPPRHGHPQFHPHGFPPNQRMNHRMDPKDFLPEDVAIPRAGLPQGENVEAPRELNGDTKPHPSEVREPVPQAQPLRAAEPDISDAPITPGVYAGPLKGPRKLRVRRAINSNNGIIGIQGAFKVVSEADLNFALNSTVTEQMPTVVLKGAPMMDHDTVYGICLPRFSFGVIFFGLGFATLVSIVIAIFLAYAHYVIKLSNRKMVDGCTPASPQTYAHESVLPMVFLRKMW